MDAPGLIIFRMRSGCQWNRPPWETTAWTFQRWVEVLEGIWAWSAKNWAEWTGNGVG